MGRDERASRAEMAAELASAYEVFGCKVQISIGKFRKTKRMINNTLQPVQSQPIQQHFEAMSAECRTAVEALSAALAEIEIAVKQGMAGSAIGEALADKGEAETDTLVIE